MGDLETRGPCADSDNDADARAHKCSSSRPLNHIILLKRSADGQFGLATPDEQQESPKEQGEIMSRTIKLYRISDDGRRVAAGAFQATSESDLQLKWELHLVTAAQGLYIATHRGVQLGIGVASDTVRQQGARHG